MVSAVLSPQYERDIRIMLQTYHISVDTLIHGNEAMFHLAVDYCKFKVIEFLIAIGANVDVRDRRDKTPLCRAAGCGCINCVVILLDAGASPRGPLWNAIKYGYWNVAYLLIDRGASLWKVYLEYPSLRIPAWMYIFVEKRDDKRNVAITLMGIRRFRHDFGGQDRNVIRQIAFHIWSFRLEG